ncbi:zinc-binding metallopeptidase family protein [Gluconobacter oxydans]|uniref:Peptidase M28 n=1 Tax=Gluconobacter oxydans TaxID=442 RepID=A0A149S7S3_GLUOY|nr:hypothetical protein [Gluconobacter oxydans]KXV22776.1 hypothetical protein AD934_00985 [Gluconobacter oxydans]
MTQKTFPRRSLFLATALTAVLLAPVAGHADPTAEISPLRMSETMKILASDRFEGRAPGTEGEKVTVPWLIEQYKALGLEPAGENGGWTQTVPMIRTRTAANGSITARTRGRTLPLIQLQDIYGHLEK